MFFIGVILAILVPFLILYWIGRWLWTKGPRGRISLGVLVSCIALVFVGFAIHERSEIKRDETSRAVLEQELRRRLPCGSSKDDVLKVFSEMKLSGDVDETILPYVTSTVALKPRGFDSRFMVIRVWMRSSEVLKNSSRIVDRIEVEIHSLSF